MPKSMLCRGMVVDAMDPAGEGRVRVEVPAVNAPSAWARRYPVPAALPEVGDTVLVAFENGDQSRPVALPLRLGDGVLGLQTLRAQVLDRNDPTRAGRLKVRIPAIWGEPQLWAAAVQPLAGRAIGVTVAVVLENGDPDRPVVLGRLQNG